MSLRAHKRDLGNCTYCPKLCRFCCPTAEVEHRETVTPWAKMSLAEMVRTGRLEAGDEVGEVFFHCFACLHCRTHCRHANDVPGALLEARRMVVAAGAEPQAVSSLIGRFHDSGNAWGEDLRARLKERVAESWFVPEAQAMLFAGCAAIRLDSDLLSCLLELQAALGVDYLAVFDGPLCCGVPLWQAGDREGFIEHARRVSRALSGVRTVVCPCPTCAYVLKGLYAQLDIPLTANVVHTTEFLAPLLLEKEPRQKIPGSAVFHDPCYLSRFLEKTDLPRRLLDRVLLEPLKDLVWSGQDALCCGGGGLVPHVLPEVAAGTSRLRMEQLVATGAERVVTACPGCIQQLGTVPQAPEVVDLVQVLHGAYCK